MALILDVGDVAELAPIFRVRDLDMMRNQESRTRRSRVVSIHQGTFETVDARAKFIVGLKRIVDRYISRLQGP